jgi:hypothetical protein
MKECSREREIVEAVASGRWPDSCGDELRSHAASCRICNEVVLVASAIHDQQSLDLAAARIPPAGLIWWRTQLRTRQEAVRRAERPLTIAHALAAASIAGVSAALIGQLLPSVRDLLTALESLPGLTLLIGAVAGLILVANVALYLVFSDK